MTKGCAVSTTVRTPSRALGLAGLLAAVALAAGCGSSDESASTSGAAASSAGGASSTATGTPIKLVALIDNTGPSNGKQGDSIPVLKAWEKDANADGGVVGHPVQVDVNDTQGNPSKAAAAVQKAIADPSVVGVISVEAVTESTTLPVLSKARLPVIGGVAYSPVGWGASKGNKILDAPPLPGVYAINTVYPANIVAWITAAQEHGLKRMVSVNFSQVPASKLATDLANSLAKGAGITASSVTVDASAPNFTAECLKIIQEKADYVIFSTPPDLSGRVIGDCNTQGYKGFYGLTGGGVTPDSYGKVGGNTLVGGLWAFPWYADTPQAKRFTSVMEANDVPKEKWQSAPGPVVWTTLELFRHVLESNKDKLSEPVTRKDVLAAYGTVKDETLDGLLPGPVTFTPGAVAPPHCYWLYTYKDDKFSGSPDVTCPPASFGTG